MVNTGRQVKAKQPQRQRENNQVTPPRPPRPSSAAKAKNLVAAAKPLKSPDLHSPVAKQTSAAVLAEDDDSVSSDTSSSSTRPGIPFYVQKQLAHDIEASGGINTFKKGNEQTLAALCNKAPDVYGKRGDRLREQLRKKVYRWSVLAKDGLYTDKILNRFGVKSWATLSAERRASANKRTKQSTSENELLLASSSDSSGSDSEESSESSSNKIPKAVVSNKTPSRQERTEEETHPPTIVETRTVSRRGKVNPFVLLSQIQC